MRYNLTLNHNDHIYDLSQAEHDNIKELMNSGKAKGTWIQNAFISFSSIKTITPSSQPEYNLMALPEPKTVIPVDRRSQLRVSILKALKDSIGETDYFRKLRAHIESKRQLETSKP